MSNHPQPAQIWEAIQPFVQAELGTDMVEGALRRRIETDALTGVVKVHLELNTPSRPAGSEMVHAVRGAIQRLPGVQSCEVELVWKAPGPGPARKKRYFVLDAGWWGGGGFPRIEFANLQKLSLPGCYCIEPPNGDPNQYPERPHLVHVPEKRASQGLPRDFEVLAGLWIVSEPLKRVFEEVDGQAFAFSPCDFTLSDGSSGPPLYLCNVLRTLDALDEQASRLQIHFGEYVGGKLYSLAGGASLAFKGEVVGSSHVFMTPFNSYVFCDRVMHHALKSARLAGVSLRDAAHY